MKNFNTVLTTFDAARESAAKMIFFNRILGLKYSCYGISSEILNPSIFNGTDLLTLKVILSPIKISYSVNVFLRRLKTGLKSMTADRENKKLFYSRYSFTVATI